MANHYVEDGEAMFRFNYSISFLNWFEKPPTSGSEGHELTYAGHSSLLDGVKNGM